MRVLRATPILAPGRPAPTIVVRESDPAVGLESDGSLHVLEKWPWS